MFWKRKKRLKLEDFTKLDSVCDNEEQAHALKIINESTVDVQLARKTCKNPVEYAITALFKDAHNRGCKAIEIYARNFEDIKLHKEAALSIFEYLNKNKTARLGIIVQVDFEKSPLIHYLNYLKEEYRLNIYLEKMNSNIVGTVNRITPVLYAVSDMKSILCMTGKNNSSISFSFNDSFKAKSMHYHFGTCAYNTSKISFDKHESRTFCEDYIIN